MDTASAICRCDWMKQPRRTVVAGKCQCSNRDSVALFFPFFLRLNRRDAIHLSVYSMAKHSKAVSFPLRRPPKATVKRGRSEFLSNLPNVARGSLEILSWRFAEYAASGFQTSNVLTPTWALPRPGAVRVRGDRVHGELLQQGDRRENRAGLP